MKMKTVISVLLSLLLAFSLLPVSAFAAPASAGTQDALMLIFGIAKTPRRPPPRPSRPSRPLSPPRP